MDRSSKSNDSGKNLIVIENTVENKTRESLRLTTLVESQKNGQQKENEGSLRELNAKGEADIKIGDPIDDALSGRLKHGDVVEYGYMISGDKKRIRLKWSYVEIDDRKYFVCTDVIAQGVYSENGNNNWERSDLKKELDENSFGLYTASGSTLGKDPKIDGGVTILSKEENSKIEKEIPRTNIHCWLRTPYTDCYGNASYVTSYGFVYISNVSGNSGVRPAFRLKSDCLHT